MEGEFPLIGVGTMMWLPGNDDEKEQLFETYRYCLDNGYNFFDTAEVYGNGKVESLLGEFMKRDGREVKICSKFAPPSSMNPAAPSRKTVNKNDPKALLEALEGTLERLGTDSIEMYLMHTPPKKNSISDYMDVMAEAYEQKKIRKIGVCNFSRDQIEEAAIALEKHGLHLSAAMVGYNILRRYPETNGVFDVCKKYGITLIPYAPLAEGTLTGKYRGKKVPFKYLVTSYFGHLDFTKERNDGVPFVRRVFSKPRECNTKKMEPLMQVMEDIAKARGKTIAQVAVSWLITTPDINVFPIPGMRKVKQAEENFEAASFALTPEERELISKAEESCR